VPVGLAIPIIVIEGGLFECYLEETEKMRVEEINACSVEWGYPLSLNQSSCSVHIYTKSALKSLTEDADNAAQVLADGIPFYRWATASSDEKAV
jgi:hypothetical protein